MDQRTTIIFDIFGVLLRPNPLIPLASLDMKTIIRYYMHHKKSPISAVLDLIEKMPAHFPEQACYTLKYKGRFLPTIFDQWQKGITSREELSAMLNRYLEHLESIDFFEKKNDARVISGLLHYFSAPPSSPYTLMHYSSMVRVIKKLKKSGNYKLFILSNIDKETHAHIQKYHSALLELFDGMVVSCDVAHVKPEAAIFEIITTRYAINPKQALFIDDQEENCKAANAYGIATILCSSIRSTVKELKKLF